MNNNEIKKIKAQIRKQLKTISETPYVPPKPLKKPELSDYGLTEIIISEDKKQYKIFKRNKKILFTIFYVPILLWLFYMGWCQGGIIMVVITLFWAPIFLAMIIAPFTIFSEYKSIVNKKLDKFENDSKNWNWWTELYPKKKVKAYWYQLDGYNFEKELATIFKAHGYDAIVTTKSGDGGVDIILDKDNIITYVQCKAHKSKIGVAVIRELYGVMLNDNIQSGIVASLNGFTSGAIDFANGKNINLISVEDIIKMID